MPFSSPIFFHASYFAAIFAASAAAYLLRRFRRLAAAIAAASRFHFRVFHAAAAFAAAEPLGFALQPMPPDSADYSARMLRAIFFDLPPPPFAFRCFADAACRFAIARTDAARLLLRCHAQLLLR
jgi:hypothetical protein